MLFSPVGTGFDSMASGCSTQSCIFSTTVLPFGIRDPNENVVVPYSEVDFLKSDYYLDSKLNFEEALKPHPLNSVPN